MSDNFEQEIVRFAKALQQKASAENTPLEEAKNAFKALVTFYAILRKHGSADDNGGDGMTFESLQDDVHRVVKEESHGATPPIRSRPRRNGAAAEPSQG